FAKLGHEIAHVGIGRVIVPHILTDCQSHLLSFNFYTVIISVGLEETVLVEDIVVWQKTFFTTILYFTILQNQGGIVQTFTLWICIFYGCANDTGNPVAMACDKVYALLTLTEKLRIAQ